MHQSQESHSHSLTKNHDDDDDYDDDDDVHDYRMTAILNLSFLTPHDSSLRNLHDFLS